MPAKAARETSAKIAPNPGVLQPLVEVSSA
jgi:hypothetical protein